MFLSWLAGALVGVGGSDFIGYGSLVKEAPPSSNKIYLNMPNKQEQQYMVQTRTTENTQNKL